MAYVSEFTKFMNDWLVAHPKELQVRQQGYQLWWKKSAPALGAAAKKVRKAAQKTAETPFFIDTTQR